MTHTTKKVCLATANLGAVIAALIHYKVKNCTDSLAESALKNCFARHCFLGAREQIIQPMVPHFITSSYEFPSDARSKIMIEDEVHLILSL